MAEVFRFLKELKENNNREWFNAHKEWYLAVKARHEDFINQVIPALAVTEPDMDGLTAKDCIFRIYRDVRFSPNKEPCKTHIGAYMVKAVSRVLGRGIMCISNREIAWSGADLVSGTFVAKGFAERRV